MHKHDNYDNLHYYIKQTLYKGSVSLNENGVNKLLNTVNKHNSTLN